MPQKPTRYRYSDPQKLNSAQWADEAADEGGQEFKGHSPGLDGPDSHDLDWNDLDSDLDNEYAEPEPGDFWFEPQDDEI